MHRHLKLCVSIFVLFIISISLILVINTSEAKGSVSKQSYKTVVVQKGDTLWNIVEQNCSGYKDIRKVIYDLKKLNNIPASGIVPGQKLLLPSELCKS